MVSQWTAAVNGLFHTLHGHKVKALAVFSLTMARAAHCHSGRLAAVAGVATDAKPASSRRRWERLLANRDLDGSAALSELAGSLMRHWGGCGRHLLLVLDETPNGEDLRCLRLGVAYRKRLVSIAAVCYPTDRPPLPMPKLICRMLRKAARLLPEGCRVTLLTDRGLSWPAVMDCARKLGWGHVMRLQHSTRVTLEDGRVVAAGELAPRRGCRWSGRVHIFKKAGWRAARLTAVWDGQCQEPWLLAAREGGPGGTRAVLAYAKRNWCEQTFRDEKSGGFQWGLSRVRDPDRAARLVLVMALATLLSLSLGTWLVKAGRRGDLDPHRQRRLSYFQLGMRWLHHMLSLDSPPLPPYLPYLHPS
jgi:hypothetical protein